MQFPVAVVLVEHRGSEPEALRARHLGVFAQEPARDADVLGGRVVELLGGELLGLVAGFGALVAHGDFVQIVELQVASGLAVGRFEGLGRRFLAQFLEGLLVFPHFPRELMGAHEIFAFAFVVEEPLLDFGDVLALRMALEIAVPVHRRPLGGRWA